MGNQATERSRTNDRNRTTDEIRRVYERSTDTYVTKPTDLNAYIRPILGAVRFGYRQQTLRLQMIETAANNILLVEDNPADARLITDYLNKQAGPNGNDTPAIQHVERLAEAVDARHADVDVILLDLGLPDSQKFDTIETMLDASGDEPIVVLTGLDDERVGTEAVERGAQDYLVKDDLTPKLLRQTLRFAIERERQQQEMKQADTLFQNAQDGLFVIDVEDGGETFRVKQVNSTYERLTGASAGELRGKTIDELADEADSDSIREKYRKCVNGRTSLEYEEYLSSFDSGSWWETRIAPVLVDGNVTQIVGSTRNITDRKERENRLKKFEQMVQHTGHAVFFTDSDGQFEYVNPEFEQLTGYSAADALGETPELLNSGEHDDAHYADLWETVLDGVVWSGEIVNERKDGTQFVANHTIAPVTDDSGEVTHFVAIYDDITERKEREMRLQTHEIVVQAMNEMAFLVDEQKQIRFANKTALDYADASLEELVGLPIVPITEEMAAPDEDPQRFLDAIDALLTDEEPDVGEWVQDPDGSETLSLEFDFFLESIGDVCVEQRFAPVELYDGTRGVAIISRDVTARREQEEEIQTHLEQAQEVGNVGSWHLDIGTSDLQWSNECYRIFGLEPGTPMTYERFLGMVHPEDREAVEKAWSEALEKGGYDLKHRIVADGETGWVQETAKVEYGPDGEPETGIGVVRNITEQVQQTRKTRTQKERYESLLQSAPDPVFVADTNTGEVIEANEAAESLREQDRDEIIGLHQSKLHPPDERERAGELFGEATNGSGGAWREYPDGSQIHTVTSTGETVPVEVTVNTFSLPDGNVSYGIFRDITEQIEREREIIEQKRRYESLFNSIRDPIVVTDTDGRIANCNPGFTNLFGYELDEIVGQPVEILLATDKDVNRSLLLGDNATYDITEKTTREYRKRSGQEFPGEMALSQFTDAEANVLGHIYQIRDVSDREKNRQQMKVIDRVLRHNIKNDMTAIIGHAELIETNASSELQPSVEKIQEVSQKFVDTAEKQRKITGVLTEPPKLTAFDIVPIVESTVTEIQKQYPAADVRATLPEALRVRAIHDIGEAIRELLRNAVVHSDKASPTVDIDMRNGGETSAISIVDDGPGIPEMESNVLTRQAEIDPLYHGSGLGLWLVHEIVRRSDGRLTFEENGSNGSTVTVHLPTA